VLAPSKKYSPQAECSLKNISRELSVRYKKGTFIFNCEREMGFVRKKTQKINYTAPNKCFWHFVV
jgi:hypothetical protein